MRQVSRALFRADRDRTLTSAKSIASTQRKRGKNIICLKSTKSLVKGLMKKFLAFLVALTVLLSVMRQTEGVDRVNSELAPTQGSVDATGAIHSSLHLIVWM